MKEFEACVLLNWLNITPIYDVCQSFERDGKSIAPPPDSNAIDSSPKPGGKISLWVVPEGETEQTTKAVQKVSKTINFLLFNYTVLWYHSNLDIVSFHFFVYSSLSIFLIHCSTY